MKFQFLNTAVLSEEIFQNAVLRITTGNISKKKSRERLIEEHKKLEYFVIKMNMLFITPAVNLI